MVDYFDDDDKKKRKKDDKEEDDFTFDNFDDFIKYLAENFQKIIPEFENFFRDFQDQVNKGNFNFENLSDFNSFKKLEKSLPQKSKAATISKPYPTKDVLIDVIDRDDKIIIIADLPGLEKEDIKLNLKNKSVLISVHKKKILKRIHLDTKIDKNNVSASYINGILEITLSKA